MQPKSKTPARPLPKSFIPLTIRVAADELVAIDETARKRGISRQKMILSAVLAVVGARP